MNIGFYQIIMEKEKQRQDVLYCWLEKNDISPSEFARTSGLSRQLISKHKLNPDISWQPQHAIVIEKHTNGEVTAVSCITQGKLKGKSKVVKLKIESMLKMMLENDDLDVT